MKNVNKLPIVPNTTNTKLIIEMIEYAFIRSPDEDGRIVEFIFSLIHNLLHISKS